MATTNPVSQLLVTGGNAALLAAGSRPEALAVGQLGIFNYHTGLSVDGSVAADTRDIFLAVGIDPNGVGSIQDINKSAGQVIQVRNTKSLTYKGTVDPIAKVIEVTGLDKAKCETDYAIKLELRAGQIYVENGYNQFAKTYSMRTGCCADSCEPCGDGLPSELAIEWARQINLDPDALVVAALFSNKITATVAAEPTAAGTIVVTVGTTAYSVAIVDADTVTTAAAKIVAVINTQAGSPYTATNALGVISIYPKVPVLGQTDTLVYTTPVAGMTIDPIVAATKTTITDGAAFVAANPGAGLGLRLTAAAILPSAYTGDINLGYEKGRELDIIVSFPGGQCETAFTATTITELQKGEGLGYDLQQIEYVNGGWNGKPGPYRQSSITGLQRNGIVYFANKTTKYNQFVLTYDQMSVAGWLEHLNNLETIIAVPCDEEITTASIADFFALIFTQFGTMANDVALNGDCSNTRTGLAAPGTDGIESLS